MALTLARSIKYPGKKVAAGKRTDTSPPKPDSIQAFEEGLEEIASAERDAASDADLIHLG
jgi:hypothetical protein